MITYEKLNELAHRKKPANQKFFARLKSRIPSDLDALVHAIHEDVFSHINCIDCAYCCKYLGPRITARDIKVLSKFLRIKPEKFIETFLKMDEEGDFIFKKTSCPFLLPDNYCSVYEVRPKACSDYPHTDRRKFHQILNLTLKNTYVCPAVFEIAERLKSRYR